MPIYAYKCASCGHEQDVLQKMSDPRLTVCPECGQSTYVKQVTAAGFQLKGTGWYVTDFRNNGASGASSSGSASHPHASNGASHTHSASESGNASSGAASSASAPAAKAPETKAAGATAAASPSAPTSSAN